MAASAEALLNTLAGGDSGGDQLSDGGTGTGEGTGAAAQDNGAAGTSQESGGAAGSGSSAAGDTQVGENQQRAGDGKNPAAGGSAPDQVANLNAAIRETRGENKALKQQLQELTAKIEALSKPKAEEAPEPDFLADPKAYVDDTRKQIKELTEKLDSKEKQQTEAQQQQQQAQETWNKVLASEAEFAAATPDYHDALNHVRAIRSQQITIEIRETQDREPTQQEIAQILATQEAQGAAALIAKGKNPSKFYYEYAKTFGYKPKAATPPPAAKPDKDAVRTMGSGGGAENVGADEPEGALGILAAAQTEHKAQFKRRK